MGDFDDCCRQVAEIRDDAAWVLCLRICLSKKAIERAGAGRDTGAG